MKLFPAKCHERATLRKLWRQMGNSSLLPAKCWPLLHVIRACSWRWPDVVAGISARFSKLPFFFVLLYNKSLNDWSFGKQWILFPSNLNVSLDFVSGNIEILGKKICCSPQDQSLSVYYCPLIEALQTQSCMLCVSSPVAMSWYVHTQWTQLTELHSIPEEQKIQTFLLLD